MRHFALKGQVELEEASAASGPDTVNPLSSFDLVAEYTYSAAAEDGADTWTLGQDLRAGKRLRFNLLPKTGISTHANPAEVRAASLQTGEPVLWLARSQDAPPSTYTLVAIGDARPLLDLQFGFKRSILDLLPFPSAAEIKAALGVGAPPPASRQPVAALADVERVTQVQLRAELVTRANTFIPLTIDMIDWQVTLDVAKVSYPSPGFALHKTDTDIYRLFMVLNDDGAIGAPGDEWEARCESWKGGGWWSDLQRAWFGCP